MNFAFRKALVPVNSSDISDRVILKAAELFQLGFVQEIVLLSVWEADEVDYTKLHSSEKAEALKAKAKTILDGQKAKLEAQSIQVECILAGGDPSEVIIHSVEKGDYDLIIMGSRKLNKVQEVLFGSVSDRVTRLVSVPILVVK